MQEITALEVSKIFNVSEKTLRHPASRFRPYYLGSGLFNYEALRAYQEYLQYQDWFTKQVYLFVEYLNKVEGIAYQEIANRVGMSQNITYLLKFSYKKCVVLLVKFRDYASRFDDYYSKGE